MSLWIRLNCIPTSPNEVEWADYALILGDAMLKDIGHHLLNVIGSHPKIINPSTSSVPTHIYCISF